MLAIFLAARNLNIITIYLVCMYSKSYSESVIIFIMSCLCGGKTVE